MGNEILGATPPGSKHAIPESINRGKRVPQKLVGNPCPRVLYNIQVKPKRMFFSKHGARQGLHAGQCGKTLTWWEDSQALVDLDT